MTPERRVKLRAARDAEVYFYTRDGNDEHEILHSDLCALLDAADERDALQAEVERLRSDLEISRAASDTLIEWLRKAEGWLEETWPRRAEQIREVLGDS